MPEIYDGRVPPGLQPGAGTAGPSGSSAEVPTGARLAGVILLLNAAALVAEGFLIPSEGKGITDSPVSMGIDFLIGGALLIGSGKFLTLAKIRAALGGLILPAIHMASGDPVLAALQVVFSVGLLLLLLGDAGKLRIGVGVAVVGLCLGLEAIGLHAAATGGGNPLARLFMSRELEKQAVSVVEGENFRYRLTSPNQEWYLRKSEVARKDNPLADRWLVRPDRDAHVMVIAEEVPGVGPVDVDRFAEIVIENARKAAGQLEIVSREPLPHRLPARLIHTRGTIDGMQVESYYGLFVRDRVIFQVMAFTRREGFAAVEPELLALIKSFESA